MLWGSNASERIFWKLQDSEALCVGEIKAQPKDMPIPTKMNLFTGWKRSQTVNLLWHSQLVLPKDAARLGLSFDPLPDGLHIP